MSMNSDISTMSRVLQNNPSPFKYFIESRRDYFVIPLSSLIAAGDLQAYLDRGTYTHWHPRVTSEVDALGWKIVRMEKVEEKPGLIDLFLKYLFDADN